MNNPKPINLSTPSDVREAGWGAEARDDDGHLMSIHVPFYSDDEALRYFLQSLHEGWTVTAWPVRKDR